MDRHETDAFRRAVYDIVRLVPRGRATSYGAIARAAGYPGYARLVGRMLATCPDADEDLPAHRVVDAQGRLSARETFGGDRMQRLLEAEGIVVAKDRIRRWRHVFWDPSAELANF